jgi:4-hydroxy-3-methylbut-2-en-1-yl diphosphate synthase IspG/GcpE
VDSNDDRLKYSSNGVTISTAQAVARGKDWFINAQLGAAGNNGRSSGKSALTMAQVVTAGLGNADRVYLSGVLREQINMPADVFDVKIIGDAGKPRQATDGGVPTGGGACWLAPTSPTATTPLIRVSEQGFIFSNIFFAAETDAACIQFRRDETAAIADGSHFQIFGCKFGGGLYGIEDKGGNGQCLIEGNEFNDISGASAVAIKSTSTAIALPLRWRIINNFFANNKNHIVTPLSSGEVTGNNFGIVGHSVTTVAACSLTGGQNNSVSLNILNRPANTSPNATLYVGGTNDLWSHNFGTDAVIYGVPDNS